MHDESGCYRLLAAGAKDRDGIADEEDYKLVVATRHPPATIQMCIGRKRLIAQG
jgi:hypothetical protein